MVEFGPFGHSFAKVQCQACLVVVWWYNTRVHINIASRACWDTVGAMRPCLLFMVRRRRGVLVLLLWQLCADTHVAPACSCAVGHAAGREWDTEAKMWQVKRTAMETVIRHLTSRGYRVTRPGEDTPAKSPAGGQAGAGGEPGEHCCSSMGGVLSTWFMFLTKHYSATTALQCRVYSSCLFCRTSLSCTC